MKLRWGGGGTAISMGTLRDAMKSDFPNNDSLRGLNPEPTSKSSKTPEIVRTSINVPGSSTQHAIRFTRLIPGDTTALASHSSLAISDMPLMQQDLLALGCFQHQPKRRTVALLDRPSAEDVLNKLCQANLRVRLPTYSEWQFAMAANGDAPHTPQHTVPPDVEPALDHWVRNEWGIGRPPASICEWIADEAGMWTTSIAPVGRIRVNGGDVTFASATRPSQHRLPVRLVLESDQ